MQSLAWVSSSLVPAGAVALAGLLSATLVGCQSVPLKEAGTLTSYGKLGPSKGMVAKKRLYVDGQRLVDVKTVRIAPTTFSFAAASKIKSDADRDLVSNALDRALCVALSDRYQMVPANQPADLTVRSVIADIVPTDKALAGVSTAITIGTGFVLPVSVPRLPVGLGGLAVEAEAVDASGLQSAAMLWARGANSILDKPRVSEVGDAYSFSTKFADAFSQVLISGKEPKALDISLPTRQRMQSWLGGKPKYAACDAFGRAPGLVGAIAAKYGAPPQWTDKKPKAAAQQAFNSPIAR
ncbi:hypothetical protein ASD01_20940 [Ensifer sp. Root423]|uniref:DUF3313 domain-containing protein n=1 Tax=Ensifer TaxID=106591 RepID=UPI00071469A7|nr:hypothetical protein ASD01_20940 [Ensifer sp. Root423]MBD9498120.1 DUF3313 domain-containing protein [Ensifer sp. ENS01]MBD9542765.1 DUF3313 domain-containing protein [Ensifer sp. ENS04]MBD9626723.1 DUF3313 domain-containing protein [Ensifer sp. ENS06]THA62045.1 DUF3313 domain-containing protein [Ensifer adhaerens]